MCNSAAHNARPARESLSKRLGKVARQIKARDGERCVYCARTAAESGSALHLDHLLPRALGGTDTAENLVVACRRCNCARQALRLATWERVAVEHGVVFSARAVRRQALRALPVAA